MRIWLASVVALVLLRCVPVLGGSPETRLYVRSNPPGAVVRIDGKALGKSDGLFPVGPGTHTVRVDLTGYKPVRVQVTVEAERITRLAVDLQVTVDDFLPPVQGGPTDIGQPGKIVVKGNVVSAATTQDALNAAVRQSIQDFGAGAETELGARMARFPSGLGFVATGCGIYSAGPDLKTTRVAKRKAYVVAFTHAKKHLAEFLGGLSNEGKEELHQALTQVHRPGQEAAELRIENREALNQAVDMMLRGFVVYRVQNVGPDRVYVSIATTPKTCGKVGRLAPHAVEVADLREGIQQVLNEVRSGLVPPVGGRIVTMRATGETAFIGFGSTVVGGSSNPTMQARLDLTASKIAAARAKDALCGLIVGDRASWRGSVVESQHVHVREFELLAAGDPLARGNAAGAERLEKARQTFVTKLRATDVHRSARSGILPPGVITRTWFDAEHEWAYGMSVYVPSVSGAAAKAARRMWEAHIVQPDGDADGSAGRTGQDTDL